MKTCRHCGETKPLDSFSPNRKARLNVCKPCTATQRRKDRAARGIPARKPFFVTFWDRVKAQGECWIWTGATCSEGRYGLTWNGRRAEVAHRVAYELMVCDVPAGLQLDHLCRMSLCVNPYHLEPVTPLVNMRRAWQARREHS